MGVQECRIVEAKCDRCGCLLSTKKIGKDDQVIEEDVQGESTGSFNLVDGDINYHQYDVVCSRCRKLINSLIEKMGPVNRGTRKKKAAKVSTTEKKNKKK